MRTVTFGVACSLDGYIARVDHRVDWLQWSDDIAAISAAYWKTIDTVLMGRKTYEVALAMGTTSYAKVANYVFSRTLGSAPDPRVQVIATDAAEFVRELKSGDGKGICVMGGGELARCLFDAGLIDEIGLNLQPVILGSGIPLFFPMEQQLDLELLESRELKGGAVYVRYRVKPSQHLSPLARRRGEGQSISDVR